MNMKVDFPYFRKYKNNKTFFKIISDTEFDEISFIGNKKIIQTIQAKVLPDRNFISDLINDLSFCETISQEEYLLKLYDNRIL